MTNSIEIAKYAADLMRDESKSTEFCLQMTSDNFDITMKSVVDAVLKHGDITGFREQK
jgi:hypothetical protein